MFPSVQPDPAQTQQRVSRFLRRVRDLPALPELVTRVVDLLGQPGASASEVARLIGHEPGLSTRVLRMVNSAAFGFPRQITSIQHAVMMLGFNTTRGLVLSAGILNLFDSQDTETHRRFWQHSLKTALATQVLTSAYGIKPTDDGFSAAILHDIGRLVLHAFLVEQPLLVPVVPEMLDGLSMAEERALFGLDHTDVGALLAQKWHLPVSLAEVIQWHHAPGQAIHAPELVALVYLGNRLAHTLDETPKVTPDDIWAWPEEIPERFRVPPQPVDALVVALDESFQQAGDWLQLFSGQP